MKRDLSTTIAGWFFVAAALLYWGGWMLLHVHIGQFFEPEVFPVINEHLAYWISMYRMHIFGLVVSGLAFVSLGALLADSPARILVWPGAAVAAGGMLVWAVATAFYYHFGAWGALVYGEKSLTERQGLVDSLLINTEYLSCLLRFAHVFSGLGLAIIGAGFLKWTILPKWINVWAVVMGVVAMAVTMGLPEYPHYYLPVFHALPLWLASVGVILLRSGLRTTSSSLQTATA